MPTYKITGPDGRRFSVTGDSPPSAQELEEIFSNLSPPQTQSVEKAEVEEPGLFGQTMNIAGRVFNTLGRPGALTAGVVQDIVAGTPQNIPTTFRETLTPTGVGEFKKTVDFNDVLGTMGMEEGWKRAGLGLVGDVVLDPLNLLPIGALAKGLSKAGDITGISSVMKSAGAPIINAVEETFTQYPKIKNIAGNAGLTAQERFRLHESVKRHIGESAQETANKFFKDIDPEDAKKMLYEIDTMGRSTTLPAHGSGWNQLMDDQFKLKQSMGMTTRRQKNYVPYMTKNPEEFPTEAVVGTALKGHTRSDKPREVYQTLKEAVTKGGAIDNPNELLARYMSANERAVENNKFLLQMGTEFGSKTPKPGFRAMRNLNAPAQIKQQMEGVYFPQDLADELDRAVVLWDKPIEMDKIFRTATKLFKATATSIVPAHHFTNMLGNVANMYVSGMSTAQIAKQMGRAYKWTLTESGIPQNVIQAAKKYEVLGTSTMLGELAEEGTSKIVNNPVFRTARRISTSQIEEPARLALFLHNIEKGMSFEKAALKVKDVLFDYAELTKTEKNIRDYGVPFYTWMRKNIPLQIRAVVENPAAVERIGDVTQVPWNAMESQSEQQMIPEHLVNAGYAPGPFTGTEGQTVMNRFALPQFDLNKLTDPRLIIDSMNPFAKMAIEFGMGKRLTGAPIEQNDGFAPPSALARTLSPLNYILPESMQGYITPINTGKEQPEQYDRAAWLTSQIPLAFWGQAFGSTMANSATPEIPTGRDIGLRMLGLTPSVLNPDDIKREYERRKNEEKRKMMQQMVLER